MWFLTGAQGNVVSGAAVISAGNSWRIHAVADFNGDGKADLVWQDPGSGWAQVWFMSGAQGNVVSGAANLTVGNTWRIAGAADFNNDRSVDIVWQDEATGTAQVWFLGGLSGTSVSSAATLAGSSTWRIAAVGDFNADSTPDVVWQDPLTGNSQIWFLGGAQGVTVTGSGTLSGANSWRIVAPR
jgi:hypothetical protein